MLTKKDYSDGERKNFALQAKTIVGENGCPKSDLWEQLFPGQEIDQSLRMSIISQAGLETNDDNTHYVLGKTVTDRTRRRRRNRTTRVRDKNKSKGVAPNVTEESFHFGLQLPSGIVVSFENNVFRFEDQDGQTVGCFKVWDPRALVRLITNIF